ncbi:hypothetical protein OOT46_19955 [Aquabacterium sp. A7-Y]|uniref:hypothetical protein n=1 Tax=Aquabacterium sp. A7-Y TaxID=1349605 RepID=UPI00223D9C5E|nr:hypothetical protein [Aquabacterium sp. A7-Y]MCW7540113.1 hypothetical protein [Aquabacterium sp. A7-Y]
MSTALPRGGYAARDVVNAPALKSGIERRSRERGDAVPVRDWLLNHFYRHVVGNLAATPPQVQQLVSADQARALFAPAAVPAWVGGRLGKQASPAVPMWWVDPEGETLLALEARLVEFLGSRSGTSLDGKLMRVNCPQALALWAAEHAAFEAQATAGLREHRPGAVEIVWRGRQGVFVEIRSGSPELRAEMAYESQMMRHCLGQFSDRRNLRGGYGEHYASACEAGRLRLFSYRTGQQQPHITISVSVRAEDGRLVVDQIKGKQNRPPVSRYREEVLGFLNTLDTSDDTPPDAAGMGVARLRSGWQAVSSISDPADQLRLVQSYPALVRELPQPSALVQWLIAARHPELLHGLPLVPGVSQALEAVR